MSKSQIKNISIASIKAVIAIVLFTGKAFLYLCLALYVVGELMFAEYAKTDTPIADPWEEPSAPTKPIVVAAKSMTTHTVLAIDLPEVDEPSDAEKESIAIGVDADRYKSMTSPQLRKECSTVGIKWRNTHGPSKHLSKAEMLTALAA